MSDYATINDITQLKRSLTSDEQNRARHLIPIISSLIRYEAKKSGRDFDEMIYQSELVSIVDAFIGDGEDATFTLSNFSQGEVVVTVNGEEWNPNGYTIVGRTLTFSGLIPSGEILVMYQYRALADVVRGVVCDIVMRELNTPGNQLPATSYSETAGSVSQSYSLPNSSGSIKLWPSDLKTLGLKRQKIDAIDLMTPRKWGC